MGDLKDGKLSTIELNGKTPIVNGDGSAPVTGSDEVQTTGLKELIRQGDEKTKAKPVPVQPVVIKAIDNKTNVDTIRKMVQERKKKIIDAEKKNVTQQVPEELGATGGSVPKPIHASGATGLGKSPNDGGISGAQGPVKVAASTSTGGAVSKDEAADRKLVLSPRADLFF